jgi:predicted small metal-binding protein
MTQQSEGLFRYCIVRCSDVGLDCGHVIFGNNEYAVMHNALLHMQEYHAIIPEEMTTCMKLKIRENIHSYRDPARTQILYELSNVSEITLPVI